MSRGNISNCKKAPKKTVACPGDEAESRWDVCNLTLRIGWKAENFHSRDCYNP